MLGLYEGDVPELLFDITAVLVASSFSPAVEAFAGSNLSVTVAVAPLAPSTSSLAGSALGIGSAPADTAPSAFLAPSAASASGLPSLLAPVAVSRVPLAQLSGMTGTALLQQMGLLTRADLASFLTTNPTAVTDLLAAPPAAREVTSWWQQLGRSEQSLLETGAPQLVGNLDGVPFSVRDTANRRWVTESVDTLTAPVDGTTGRAVARQARQQAHLLGEVSTALSADGSDAPRSLLSVDSVGQGKAAIVLGDLDTADYVTYLVPGMFFTVDGQISDWTDAAQRIYDEQVGWIDRFSDVNPDMVDTTVAVVAWMGYETPNLTNIATLDLAARGSDAIAKVVQGLQSERAGDLPYISIIAHSYGSTATMMALDEYDLDIDALTVIGSPGSPAASADDLSVKNGNVWVGEAAWDPIAHTAYFGSDPGSAAFGAHYMDVSGGEDSVTHATLAAAIGHNGYFTEGSRSVRNLALIGLGRDDLVSGDGGTGGSRSTTLASAG